MIESTISGGGVHLTTVGAFIRRSKDWEIRRLVEKTDKLHHLRAKALQEDGKKYDLTGVAGLGINRDWQDNAKWWCTELVAYLLKAIGYNLMSWDEVHWVNPRHCYDWPQETIARGSNG